MHVFQTSSKVIKHFYFQVIASLSRKNGRKVSINSINHEFKSSLYPNCKEKLITTCKQF